MRNQKKMTVALLAAIFTTLASGSVNADSIDKSALEDYMAEQLDWYWESRLPNGDDSGESDDDDPGSGMITVDDQTHSPVNDSSEDDRHTLPSEFNQNTDTELKKPDQNSEKDESNANETTNDGNTESVSSDPDRIEENNENQKPAEDSTGATSNVSDKTEENAENQMPTEDNTGSAGSVPDKNNENAANSKPRENAANPKPTEINTDYDLGNDLGVGSVNTNAGTIVSDIPRQESDNTLADTANTAKGFDKEDIVIASTDGENISSKAGISEISDSVSSTFWTWPCILLLLLSISVSACIKSK